MKLSVSFFTRSRAYLVGFGYKIKTINGKNNIILMNLFLVTSNKHKAKDILKISKDFGISLKWIKFDVPEIQGDDIEKIAREKAKFCSKYLRKNVVVADAGLFIEALNGFPGTLVKWVLETIGNDGILKLMKGVRNRRAKFVEAIGFCKFGSEPKSFIGITYGEITQRKLGNKGFGFDAIFKPYGYNKTYGQDPELRLMTTPLREAIRKFSEYVKK
jgi:XTP/dITP diphosphohydrolase